MCSSQRSRYCATVIRSGEVAEPPRVSAISSAHRLCASRLVPWNENHRRFRLPPTSRASITIAQWPGDRSRRWPFTSIALLFVGRCGMFGGFLCPDPLPEFLKFLPQPPCGRGGGLPNRNRYQFLLFLLQEFLLQERCVEPDH